MLLGFIRHKLNRCVYSVNKLTTTIVLLLILFSLLSIFSEIKVAEAEPKTIVVPDDYPTIGWAISNASEGDAIFVKSGIYNEIFLINKSLSLVGEDKETTIIKAHNPEIVVSIRQDGVYVTGFTILAGETPNPKSNLLFWV